MLFLLHLLSNEVKQPLNRFRTLRKCLHRFSRPLEHSSRVMVRCLTAGPSSSSTVYVQVTSPRFPVRAIRTQAYPFICSSNTAELAALFSEFQSPAIRFCRSLKLILKLPSVFPIPSSRALCRWRTYPHIRMLCGKQFIGLSADNGSILLHGHPVDRKIRSHFRQINAKIKCSIPVPDGWQTSVDHQFRISILPLRSVYTAGIPGRNRIRFPQPTACSRLHWHTSQGRNPPDIR